MMEKNQLRKLPEHRTAEDRFRHRIWHAEIEVLCDTAASAICAKDESRVEIVVVDREAILFLRCAIEFSAGAKGDTFVLADIIRHPFQQSRCIGREKRVVALEQIEVP